MVQKNTKEDLLHAMLISSDPVITGKRVLPNRKSGSFHRDILKLMMTPREPSIDS